MAVEAEAPIAREIFEAAHKIVDQLWLSSHEKSAVRKLIVDAMVAHEARVLQSERDRLYEAGLKWPRDVCDFLVIEGAKRLARSRAPL